MLDYLALGFLFWHPIGNTNISSSWQTHTGHMHFILRTVPATNHKSLANHQDILQAGAQYIVKPFLSRPVPNVARSGPRVQLSYCLPLFQVSSE